jgi:ketosteroid isomerase-like protein
VNMLALKSKGATVFAAALLAALSSAVVAQSSSCPDTGPRSAGSLTREWILVGWEKRVGDPPFNFGRQLGRFYDFQARADEASFYDDFDPQHRLLDSPREYGAIWQVPFTSLRAAEHRISVAPKVLRDGNLAAAAMQFVARLTTADGTEVGIRTLSSLTWRCTNQGWKIVREHNSSQRLTAQSLEAAMANASIER